MAEYHKTTTSDSATIKHLRSILTDNYANVFSIVQELLQNADDAGAERVHFGVIRAFDSKHGLTSTPGIYIVNDGLVAREHIDKIHLVGEGSKENDQTQIGRFGLGMKSVYHVCDGFFLVSKGFEDAGVPVVDFCMPPWDRSEHGDWIDAWESLSEEDLCGWREFFTTALPEHVRRWQRFFGIWMPLRTADSQKPFLTPEHRSPSDFVNGKFIARALALMPLLRHVRELSFSDEGGRVWKYSVGEGALRVAAVSNIPQDRRLSGAIDGSGGTRVCYCGCETVRESVRDTFSAEEIDHFWPSSRSFDDEGKVQSVPDKTFPHSAVIITTAQCADGNGRVDLIPCSFLPLNCVYDDAEQDTAVYGQSYSFPVAGERVVSVCLHGFFFLDAGRREAKLAKPEDVIDSGLTLQRSWNSRLLEQGILPLLIPQLARAAREQQWTDTLTTEVVRRIADFAWIKGRLAAVTKELAYCHCLTEDGFRWCEVETGQEQVRFFALDPDMLQCLEDREARRVFLAAIPEKTYVVDLTPGLVRLSDGDLKAMNSARLLESVANACAADQNIAQNEQLHKLVLICAYDGTWGRSRVNFEQLSQATHDMRFWRVKGRYFSYAELKSQSDRICSLSDSEVKSAFLRTVAVDDLLQLPSSLERVLGLNAPDVNEAYVVRRLCSGIALGNDIEARSDLLSCLLHNAGQQIVPDMYRACRYLAVGDSFILDQRNRIYIFEGDSRAWQWIVRTVNRLVLDEDRDVQVDQEILRGLTRDQKHLLGFEDCTNDAIGPGDETGSRGRLIEALADKVNDVDFASFPEDGWVDVLSGLMNFAREPLRSKLRGLPIYPTDSGMRDLSGGCFYREEYEVPQPLSAQVAVLTLGGAGNERIRQIADKWTPAACVKQCRLMTDQAVAISLIPEAAVYDSTHGRTLDWPQHNAEREYLYSAEWITLRNGQQVAPKQIVSATEFPEIGGWYGEDLIGDDGVRNTRRAYSWLQRWDEQNGRLFSDLAVRPEYLIGRLPDLDLNDALCADFFDVFSSLELDCQPAVAILRKIGRNNSSSPLLTRLRANIPTNDRLVRIINSLSDSYVVKEGNEVLQNKIWRFVLAYIREASARADFVTEILPRLKFVCLDGDMPVEAQNVFWADEIIPESNTFNSSLYEDSGMLISHLRKEELGAEDVTGDAASNTVEDGLRGYFIRNLTSEYYPLAAGFILGCSCDRDDINWATQYVSENETTRERRALLGEGVAAFLENGYRVEGHAIDPICWCVECDVAANCQVQRKGILGQVGQFSARAITDARTLFNGVDHSEPFFQLGHQLKLRMRRTSETDLDLLGPVGVSTILKETLCEVLLKTFGAVEGVSVDQSAIDRYWETFDKRDQILVDTTRSIVLSGVHDYLRIIGHSRGRLAEPCKRLSNANANVVVAHDKGCSKDEIYRRLEARWEIEREIGALIGGSGEDSRQIQQELLEALRQKMTKYGYSTESLLFELFQNADDAAEEMRAFRQDVYRDEFRVEFDRANRRLIIAHWGRQINRVHNEHDGFGRDLEKMIKMFQSDKQLGGTGVEGSDVVGKFGLGFKTVFLVSDTPVIMSGLLCFKIVGGILPVNLGADERQQYGEVFKKYEQLGRAPTVIVLELRSDQGASFEKVGEAVRLFANREALLAAFSKRIKNIVLEVV